MENHSMLSKLRPAEPRGLKYKDFDDSSSSDSERYSDDDSKHNVTKKIKKMPRRKKRYRFITDEMRVQLVDAVDAGEKIKHAAKRLKINYSSAKSIFKVFKREGRFSKKVLKPKAPPKTKTAPKHQEFSETSEESQDFEEDESLAPESPEQSTNPFFKREHEEEEKELVKQESNSSPKQSEQEVQATEVTIEEPEALNLLNPEFDPAFFIQQLQQKQQRQQRNIFGSNPNELFAFGNMAKFTNPHQNMLFNPSLNQAYYPNAIQNAYPQQAINYPKQPFGTPQMLPTNFKPNNLYGLEVNQLRNFVPTHQNLPPLNYSILNNGINQQIPNPILMQNFPQINQMRTSIPSQMDIFGVNMNYYQDQTAQQMLQNTQTRLGDVKTEAKLEYSDI